MNSENGSDMIKRDAERWNDLEVFSFIFENLAYINLIFAVIIVFFQRKDSKSVWAWLLVLYFIPVLGFVFYLLSGTDMHKKKIFRTKEIEDRLGEAIRNQKMIITEKELSGSYPGVAEYSDLVLYELQTAGAILSDDNDVRFLVDGRDKFEALLEDLRGAKHSIHIQYYIIKDDEVFAAIKEVLIQKAGQGVEVRILFDAMGCRSMKKREWKRLNSLGIETAEFFPALLGKLQLRINYRNHRKIVVIDGKIGYTGGFNIAREYIGKDEKFGYWRDTHMRITGTAVWSLQMRFILDWNYANRGYALSFEKYLPEVTEVAGGACPVQIVTSGPDTREQNVRDAYLRLIHKAKKSIYIQTPYFIPDEAIYSALKIAAHSGIEVNIMIPCKPDHPFVYWATYSYIGDMVLAGAKCYIYNNGFLHAKGIVVDEMVLCYGTANMDIRSFALNFEVNALIYDSRKAREMVTYFKEDIKKSKLITKDAYLSRSLWLRVKEQVCRLFSPVL